MPGQAVKDGGARKSGQARKGGREGHDREARQAGKRQGRVGSQGRAEEAMQIKGGRAGQAG
jgi:hypothetical protein